jgi:hypothetical protein
MIIAKIMSGGLKNILDPDTGEYIKKRKHFEIPIYYDYNMGYNKNSIIIEEPTRESRKSRYYNIDDILRDIPQERMFISLPHDEKTKDLIGTFNNIYAKITAHMTEDKNS